MSPDEEFLMSFYECYVITIAHPFYGESSFLQPFKCKIIKASQKVAKIVEFSCTLHSTFPDDVFHNLDMIKSSKLILVYY